MNIFLCSLQVFQIPSAVSKGWVAEVNASAVRSNFSTSCCRFEQSLLLSNHFFPPQAMFIQPDFQCQHVNTCSAELSGHLARTVHPGAEERWVQHHSLVSFLTLLIPADLHSSQRAVKKAVQCTSFVLRMHNTTMSFQICFFFKFPARQVY